MQNVDMCGPYDAEDGAKTNGTVRKKPTDAAEEKEDGEMVQ